MERRDYAINGHTYSILLPPPTLAMPLCVRSAVLLGAAIGVFAGMPKDMEAAARTKLAMERLSQALGQVDPMSAHQLMMDAVEAAHLTFEGRDPISTPIDFDRHFSEHRREIYPVLMWCLWECISDFFPDMTVFIQKAKQMGAAALQSQEDGK